MPQPVPRKDPLEERLQSYLSDFISGNHAAKVLSEGLRVLGTGLWPLIDHITFRTLDVEARAREFQDFGYVYDENLGVIEHDHWWAKVYRKPGYPALFLDQAFEGERGQKSLIPDWVRTFGDQTMHHVALLVEDIEMAVFYLEKQGVKFAGSIVGDKGSDLRQIFTDPETRDGKSFTVLELTERHHGYRGFLPPQASGLMESTRRSEAPKDS